MLGKTSLVVALFDIILHLTDKERFPSPYQLNYICLEDVHRPALFKYTFMFGEDVVEYDSVVEGEGT